MSNHLAIATVTATLRDVVFSSVSADVPGADVTMVRPDGAGSGVPTTGVNIFLYQVSPSAAARNEDLPTRSQDGTRRPPPSRGTRPSLPADVLRIRGAARSRSGCSGARRG